MDLTKRVNDVIIEYMQERGSTPLQSNLPDGVIGNTVGFDPAVPSSSLGRVS